MSGLSLRYRLLAAVGLVVAAAVAAVGLLSGLIAKGEVHRYVSEEDARRADGTAERLQGPLQEHFRQHRGWASVGPMLSGVAAAEPGLSLLLLDAEYRVVAVSDLWLAGVSAELREDGMLRVWRRPGGGGKGRGSTLELLLDAGLVSLEDEAGRVVGCLAALPRPETVSGFRPVRLVSSIQRRVLVAVLGASLVALLATWWISGRILNPVRELTRVARAFEGGQLDVRVRVRSSDEIGRLGAAFNSMADGLERLEKLRRTMVSDAAHELRTPLTAIRCQLEALQDGLVRPEPTAFHSLHDDVMTLQCLLEDLQELAVAEAGGLRLEAEPVELGEELGRAVRSFSTGTGPELSVEVPDLPPVTADPTRLRQILQNLLQNAVRHTPAEGTVRVGAKLAADGVEIWVSDSGPGIDPEHLPNVFERFYRADAARDRGLGGAGLGLAIVKHLVEAHGGRVWAESTPGRGARFAFTLPVAGG